MSLNKLGTALSVVFLVSLVALAAEIIYVLWRRRSFRQRTAAVHGGDGEEFAGASKELLYFLCWKQRSRIEPDRNGSGGSPAPAPEDQEEVIDVLKLQEMLGRSRVLFTIKEEEREDAESEKSISTRRVTLKECLTVAGDSPEVTVTVDGDFETTPYSTPCDSPLYYTPSASPVRE